MVMNVKRWQKLRPLAGLLHVSVCWPDTENPAALVQAGSSTAPGQGLPEATGLMCHF
jgi:hypothetical protein